MALDGRITDVIEYTGGITLVLEARDPQAGPAGQPRMEILNPTVTPLKGDVIWGGAGFAIIVSGGVEYPYKREGYTKLVQDWQTDPLYAEYMRTIVKRDEYRRRCASANLSNQITRQQDIDGKNMEDFCRAYEKRNGLDRT